MALETVNFINDFVTPNPGSSDPKSQGDDHIRNIKLALKASFPQVAGPVPIAHDQFASKDYVNQTAFSTALPAQPGGTTIRYELTSFNGSATWQATYAFDNSTKLAQAQAISLCF